MKLTAKFSTMMSHSASFMNACFCMSVCLIMMGAISLVSIILFIVGLLSLIILTQAGRKDYKAACNA